MELHHIQRMESGEGCDRQIADRGEDSPQLYFRRILPPNSWSLNVPDASRH